MTKKQMQVLKSMEVGKRYGLDEARRTFNCELSDLTTLFGAGYIDIPEYYEQGRNWHFVKLG